MTMAERIRSETSTTPTAPSNPAQRCVATRNYSAMETTTTASTKCLSLDTGMATRSTATLRRSSQLAQEELQPHTVSLEVILRSHRHTLPTTFQVWREATPSTPARPR